MAQYVFLGVAVYFLGPKLLTINQRTIYSADPENELRDKERRNERLNEQIYNNGVNPNEMGLNDVSGRQDGTRSSAPLDYQLSVEDPSEKRFGEKDDLFFYKNLLPPV